MPKSKKAFGVQFDGFTELAQELEKLSGNLQDAIEESLGVIPEIVNPKLKSAIEKHEESGRTAKSLVEKPKVEWDGLKASISVGFDIDEGGLASIFLMYGTAKHAPSNQYGKPKKSSPGMSYTEQDKELYDAIYSKQTQKQISEKQQEMFTKAIEKAWKGGD